MESAPLVPLQFGLPEFLPQLLVIAGTLVLIMMLVAIVGTIYRHFTGGIEWPEDKKEDEDGVTRGGQDDEWEFY
ncbi:MAG: hypothetical protein ACLFNI_07750 [Natronomonas sp.]